jgi:hypothetical protein
MAIINYTDHIELINKLELQINSADPFAPWFTGWKETVQCDGYVGQLVRFYLTKTGDRGCVYVNLPGMESGDTSNGGYFDIGTARLTGEISLERMEAMLVAGIRELNALYEKVGK